MILTCMCTFAFLCTLVFVRMNVCESLCVNLNASLFVLPMGLIKQPMTQANNGAVTHPLTH